MKTLLKTVLFVVLLAGILLATVTPGLAQDVQPPTETPLPTPPLESGYLPFVALGEEDIIMRGPFDAADVRFTVPSSWQLEPGATLTLVMGASFSALEEFQFGSSGASVNVRFNDRPVGTIFISETGQQVFTLPIPDKALKSLRMDGRHVLDFSLDASFDCDYPHQTTVIVYASSVLNFPISQVPAMADLTMLPRPFYQQDSFLPETSLLVVPDAPSPAELQAALTVSAAFGRMSSGELDLPLLTASELTDELRANSHLILVGNSEDVSALLAQVTFPAAVTEAGDGVLQTVVSPWNDARVLLHVSGVDDTGLLKAAQALTYGLIQPGPGLQSAVISDVNSDVLPAAVETLRTFAELGYPTRNIGSNLESLGVSTLEYRFYMPPGYVAGTDPYLNLVYTHSALLDFSLSGAIVSLNDQRLSSIQFSEETAAQMNSVKIPLYADFLRPGDNRLVLQVELRPVNICSNFSGAGAWFSLHETSLVHLPLLPASEITGSLVLNLTQYPYPFTSNPSLDDLGFVLPEQDVAAWKVASKLVAEIGRRATGQILAPQVSFGDQVEAEFLQNHLVFVGLPAEFPLISEMSDKMPAPFEPGSNMVTERTLAVSYRLPEGVSLGYIQLFPSPWDSQKAVLAVLGSTPEGLGWAFDAMTVPALRGRLIGNYAVINRTQVLATDTRVGRSASGLASSLIPAEDVQILQPTPQVAVGVPVAPVATSDWILPAVAIISALILALLIFVVINSFRKRQ